MEKKVKERECSACGKVIQYSYGTTPVACPYCGSPHWNKPREEYKLFAIQDRYIAAGYDLSIIPEMYNILVFYSENIIKKYIKNKTLFSPEDLRDKAQDVALSFYEMYFKKEHYLVKYSFGGILTKIASGVLYNPKTRAFDELLSLDYELDEKRTFGESSSVYNQDQHNQETFTHDVQEEYEKRNPEDAILPVDEIILEECDHVREDFSLADSLLFLVAMRLYLEKNTQCPVEEFYNYYGDSVKQDVNNTLDRIHKELGEG